jgi:hypothetical protein
MTDRHPITPPQELVDKWEKEWHHSHFKHGDVDLSPYIAAHAAQWGADQELEACCEWFQEFYKTESWVKHDLKHFRAARRPKPPSLKEQAIAALSEMSIEPCLINDVDVNAAVCAKYNTIRRALETLPND